jgi:hypothetical protein
MPPCNLSRKLVYQPWVPKPSSASWQLTVREVSGYMRCTIPLKFVVVGNEMVSSMESMGVGTETSNTCRSNSSAGIKRGRINSKWRPFDPVDLSGNSALNVDVVLDTSSGFVVCTMPFIHSILFHMSKHDRVSQFVRDARLGQAVKQVTLTDEQHEVMEGIRLEHQLAYICGAPGCGKTTTTLIAMLCELGTVSNCRVAWVNFSGRKVTVMKSNSSFASGSGYGSDLSKLPKRIQFNVDVKVAAFDGTLGDLVGKLQELELWKCDDYVFVVFDGLTNVSVIRNEEILQKIMATVFPVKTVRGCVIISSIGVDTRQFPRYQPISVGVWSKLRYKALLNDPTFYEQVKVNLGFTAERFEQMKEEIRFQRPSADEETVARDASVRLREDLIDEKFHLAGVSCRWMVEYTPEEVIGDIQACVSRVGDLNTIGESNAEFDTLTYVLNGECIPVSAAIVRELAFWDSSKPGDGLGCLRKFAKTENPSIQAWLFEVKFLHYCRTRGAVGRLSGYRLSEGDRRQLAISFRPVRVFPFKSTDSLENDVDANDITPGALFVPRIICQGGFDAVEYVELNPHERFNGKFANK